MVPPPDAEIDELEQEGDSMLIIGRGRTGKSGKGIRLFEKKKSHKKIIVAPRRTNRLLARYRNINWPVMSVQDLLNAYEDREEGESETLVVYILRRKLEKGQPSIWEILADPAFRDFEILADELSVLTAGPENFNGFDYFIRVVGQNNQHFIGITHRIKRDLDPAWIANIQKILFIGPLHAKDEAQLLYDASTVSKFMTFDQFFEKLRDQPETYPWWEDSPSEAAVFKIYE